LFGPEAAAVGTSWIDLRVKTPATCADVREQLAAAQTSLRPLLAGARFAVNSEFAPLDRVIQPGDEVALIGMVSGG
jgi:molybdopterin converting factor small subunit